MKYFFIIMCFLSIMGCDTGKQTQVLTSDLKNEKVWVFIQLNVEKGNKELKPYYYYAKISKDIYQKISKNEIEKGFILLENVKYWGDNDLIYSYADIENSGELTFRIENIVKMDRVNVEPIVGKGYEQFESKTVENVDIIKKTRKTNRLEPEH